jgi:hypothetical protein
MPAGPCPVLPGLQPPLQGWHVLLGWTLLLYDGYVATNCTSVNLALRMAPRMLSIAYQSVKCHVTTSAVRFNCSTACAGWKHIQCGLLLSAYLRELAVLYLYRHRLQLPRTAACWLNRLQPWLTFSSTVPGECCMCSEASRSSLLCLLCGAECSLFPPRPRQHRCKRVSVAMRALDASYLYQYPPIMLLGCSRRQS